jgi:hypothetical protein
MSLVVCVELLLMYQIPHGEVHILHIYICVHTPHVRDTGRSPHGAGPGATDPARLSSAGSDTPQGLVLRGIRPRWQIKTPQNQTKMFLELAILFKGTLFENRLHV